MKNALISGVAIFVILAAMPYCTAAGTNEFKNHFEAADTNRDGKVSLEEFKQYAKQEAFKNADQNGDKKIDWKEWVAAAPSPQAESNFESVDKNRDKTVSFLEFSEKTDKNYNYDEIFNNLDQNRDGSLAPDEFNARPAFTILSIKF